MRQLLIGGSCLGLLAAPAFACCMVPRTYEGTISQNAQEAVMIWHDGREELVLRIDYAIGGAETMPEQFAWIVTVPNEPDAYAVSDATLFREMFRFAERHLHQQPRSNSRAEGVAASAGGIELGTQVQVGPYDIQPVRAHGKAALEGLNQWLANNEFPTEDPAHMAYFVENGFTFLCIKVRPAGSDDAVAPGGVLPPLQLSFASERPYYPLRFSSRQGVFDVNLYVLTRQPFDYGDSKQMLERINWRQARSKKNVSIRPKQLPRSLHRVFGEGRIPIGAEPWHVNNLRGWRVNHDNAIAAWEDDIFFTIERS